jgi:hypothetical protein
MFVKRRAPVSGALFLLLVGTLVSAESALALPRCLNGCASVPAPVVTAVRLAVQERCDCRGASSPAAHARCVKAVLKGRTDVPKSCRRGIASCEVQSVCGRGEAVVCCAVGARGRVKASIGKSRCRKGVACALPYLADACAAGTTAGCAPVTIAQCEATRGLLCDLGDGTLYDSSSGLQWEKKNGVDGTPGEGAQDAGNLHDVDNVYMWSMDCIQACQPTPAAAATCAAQTGGAYGCRYCCEVCGFCNEPRFPTMCFEPSCVTIWEWLELVNASRLGGYDDWRIPTHAGEVGHSNETDGLTGAPPELESLIRCGRARCETDAALGPTVRSRYWSGSTVPESVNNAYQQEMPGGGVTFHGKEVGFGYGTTGAGGFYPGYVRAVRGTLRSCPAWLTQYNRAPCP